MAPSNSSPLAQLDRALFGGMALGTALMLLPWWGGALRAGFFLTLACTLLEIVTGHLLPGAEGS